MWGLGCLLYEMLALEHPFTGSNLGELSLQVMNAEYKPAPPHYSADLRALLGALLSATPADRPTAAALLMTPVLRSAAGLSGAADTVCSTKTLTLDLRFGAHASLHQKFPSSYKTLALGPSLERFLL